MKDFCRALIFGTASLLAIGASAQENQGQMGTQPKPAVTTPATQAHPDKQATTPTAPQTKPAPADPTQTPVDKPESAVGGTQPLAPQPQALPEASRNQDAGALQLVQPDAQELRSRIDAALQREPSLNGANIVLNISDNSIDISGNANTPRQRLTARRIVQSFAGNRKVTERITVAGMAPRQENPQTMVPQHAPATADKPATENRPKSDPEKQGDASGKPR